MLPPRSGLLDLKAASAFTRLPISTLRGMRNRGKLQPAARETLAQGSHRDLYRLEDLAPLIREAA